MVLHHVISGKGPVTCFAIHGGPGVDHTYLRPLDALGLPLRIVYADLPGHGGNAPLDPADVSHDTFVASLEDLRAHVGVERVLLLAHSWGPSVALDYALAYPERVAGLVLVSPGFATDPEDMHRRAMGKSPALARRFFGGWDGTDAGMSEWLREVAPLYFHRYDAARHGPSFADVRCRAAMMAFGGLGGEELEAAVREVSGVPTLVLSGDDDFILPPAAGARVAAAIPGATHHVFESCGHFAWIEKPDEFKRVVGAWLASSGLVTLPAIRP